MPCSDSLITQSTKDSVIQTHRLSQQVERISYLEACLCALLTELEKIDIGGEIIAAAEKSGQVDIVSFWDEHKKDDKQRLVTAMKDEFSAHERDAIKRLFEAGKL